MVRGELDAGRLKNILTRYDQSIELIDGIRRRYNYAEAKLDLIASTKKVFEFAIQTALQLYNLTQEQKYLETAFNYAACNNSFR